MLTALLLGNFKAFAARQTVPLRPLTLVFGANSSGKSSLLHSLLLARHVHETGRWDTHRTTLGGDAVDLGGFGQFLFQHDRTRPLSWGLELDTRHTSGRLAALLAPVQRVRLLLTVVQPTPRAAPEVQGYELAADDAPLLRLERQPDGQLHTAWLDPKHPLLRHLLTALMQAATTSDAITADDDATLAATIARLQPDLVFAPGPLLPGGLAQRAATPGAELLLFPLSAATRADDLAAAVAFFLPRALDDLLRELATLVADELTRLRYLGPLRAYPPRHLHLSDAAPDWSAGGAYAWEVVRRDAAVRAAVNGWLGMPDRLHTPYELVVRALVSLDDLSATQGAGQPPPADLPITPELLLRDRRTNTLVSHRDIGIGISQVLPVLVAALAAERSLLAIEQPELHLHPALQAELGDVCIEAALGTRQNRLLLETHSEHLLLRVMRRMRDTQRGTLPPGLPPVRPQDVALLFVQPAPPHSPAAGASLVRELELDAAGDLLDPWPGGFFEEGFHERFS